MARAIGVRIVQWNAPQRRAQLQSVQSEIYSPGLVSVQYLCPRRPQGDWHQRGYRAHGQHRCSRLRPSVSLAVPVKAEHATVRLKIFLAEQRVALIENPQKYYKFLHSHSEERKLLFLLFHQRVNRAAVCVVILV